MSVNVLIIPAHARSARDAAWLARCVLSALAQRALHEIVVVDDASPWPLPPLGDVTLLRLPVQSGPSSARNAGLDHALARGARIVLFTDVDCMLEPGWAEAMEAFLARSRHVAAGGVTRAFGSTLLDRYHDFAGTLNGQWVLPERRELAFGPTCNLAVRAEAAARVRFDPRFPGPAAEDFDFCHRLRALGTIGLNPRAVVRHDFGYAGCLSGLPRFTEQFRRYGAGGSLLLQKHPDLAAQRSERCAPPDPRRPFPEEAAAWGRPSLNRLGPGPFQLAMTLLRLVSKRAYRRGLRAGSAWRLPAPRPAPAPAPVARAADLETG
jgi:GT2 family glycosyltransferase